MPSAVAPVTTENWRTRSRSVTGSPMRAAQAWAAVTPGTTSTGIPARCSAAISSAARPKMNGSPPLSRATTLPALASRTRMRLISACGVEAPCGSLPTKMRSASRRA